MLEPGSVIAETYVITRRIGAGGMGEVFEARHVMLPRRFAIKVMRMGSGAARFQQEAMVTARLAHPNIVEVVDFKVVGDDHCLVMELLEGESLAERMDRDRLATPAVLAVLRQVAAALSVAHRAGVVHRDLKPQNIFLARLADGREQVKVLDFGISKQRGAGPKLTAANMIVGSPHYMAPEQAIGRSAEVDARTDVFALGVLTYEMLTGVRAFPGTSEVEVLRGVIYDEPPRLDALDPPWPMLVADAVAQAISKRAADRFETAQAFLAALEAALGSLAGAAALDGTTSGGRSAAGAARSSSPRSVAQVATLASRGGPTAEAPTVASAQPGPVVAASPGPTVVDSRHRRARSPAATAMTFADGVDRRHAGSAQPAGPDARTSRSWLPWLFAGSGLLLGLGVVVVAVMLRPSGSKQAGLAAVAHADLGPARLASPAPVARAELARPDLAPAPLVAPGAPAPPLSGRRRVVLAPQHPPPLPSPEGPGAAPTSTPAAAPAPPPRASCPRQCTGGCKGSLCRVDCSAEGSCYDGLECAPGMDCEVTCGPRACGKYLDCKKATSCTFRCNGPGACSGSIDGGTGPCNVRCRTGACLGSIECILASSTDVLCEGNSCHSIEGGRGSCKVTCRGGSCVNKVDCRRAARSEIRCEGASCAGSVEAAGVATVRCQGKGSCSHTVSVERASSGRVECLGDDSCAQAVNCPRGGRCVVSCAGARSCPRNVHCEGSCACSVSCAGPGACRLPVICPPTCSRRCGPGEGCDACPR